VADYLIRSLDKGAKLGGDLGFASNESPGKVVELSD
jgi:hypothetical protein